DAPVVWGKVVVQITRDRVPVSIRYFDEKGELVRTMSYADVRDIAGRKVPMQMTLVPADKPGEFTKMTFDELKFDVPIHDKTFTLQALKGN
ncbi:MAG: outer membrane lipoprotein-sorting protein, partial [Myxococcales bacterium]|nr:outer membrane lipoprotein-sorting protein [Myxococcales bacterium]